VFGAYRPLCFPSVVGANRRVPCGRATAFAGGLVGTPQNLSRGSPFLCNLLFLSLVVLVLGGREGRRQGSRDEVKGGVARELRLLRSELSEGPRLALFAREA
jgi:hypothetical protein